MFPTLRRNHYPPRPLFISNDSGSKPTIFMNRRGRRKATYGDHHDSGGTEIHYKNWGKGPSRDDGRRIEYIGRVDIDHFSG